MSLQRAVSDWSGLIRLRHTIFALPFAGLAAIMAWATPLPTSDPNGTYPGVRLPDILGILLCMVFARSAAMAFNRVVDRRFDAENPRTVGRHLPAGILSPQSVWVFTGLCVVGFIASTCLFLPNRWPLIGSVPVILFLGGYSMAKRFTSASHLWLGVALSLSPICAWVAIRGAWVSPFSSDLLIPATLAVAVAAWVNGFDIIYACQDADFDRQAGLHSVPAKQGIKDALRVAKTSHVVMISALVVLSWVGRSSGLGTLFAMALVVVTVLVLRQHRLVSPKDLERVGEAFFNVNAWISVTLLVAGILDCWVV